MRRRSAPSTASPMRHIATSQARARASVGRLQIARHRARQARTARSRSARAPRHHRRGRQGQVHRLPRPAGIHAPDRRDDDPGQCRRGRKLEKARQPLIYRIHEEPSKEKLFAFSDYLRTIGMSFAKGQVVKPGIFNRILAQAKGGPHAEVMNDVVLRTQAQAVYSPDNVGHFGLNLQRYAHFTSPIRRYADLIVHRALIRALKFGDDGLSNDEMGSSARSPSTSRCASAAPWRPSAIRRIAMSRPSWKTASAPISGARHRRHALRPVRAAQGDGRRRADPRALLGHGIFPPRRAPARSHRRPQQARPTAWATA
jgi:hypothetical protein